VTGDWDTSRRRLLAALGAATAGGTAGCSGQSSDTTDEGAATETVVFTDTEATTTTAETTRESDISTTTSEELVFGGGDAEAFRDALVRASEIPDATLEIEPGTYRFSPIREQGAGTWWHIRAPEVEDVTIEGNGATIYYTEPRAAGLYFSYGSDVTVRDLTVDYDPVPFTQGSVVDISGDRRTIELELDDGYPGLDHEMFDAFEAPGGSIHTPDGEFISGTRQRGRLDKYYSDIESIGDRRYRLQLDETCTTTGLGPDRKLLIKARRSKPAFYFFAVDRPTVSNVTVHASNGGGFLMDVCDSPTVRDCVVAPPADSDRLIGIDSDGVRFVNDTGPPTVENSRFEYTGDDPVVVQQTMTSVTEVVDDRTVRVAEWHPWVVGPDDQLRGLTQSGEVLGDLPAIESIEFRYDLPERGKPETITFAEPIDDVLSETALVKNDATASRGFAVRGNTVRNVRGRLVRIAAPDGVVEGNTLEGSHSAAVEIECDTDDAAYAPKGGVSGVVVRDNDIVRPGMNYLADRSPAGVRVHHLPRDGESSEGRPNRDIVVENNRIERGAHAGVEVEHAENVEIRNNELADLNRLSYPGEPNYGVRLRAVESSTVTGNHLSGPADSVDALGGIWDSRDVETADNTVERDGDQSPGEFEVRRPVTVEFERVAGEGGRDTVGVRCFGLVLTDGDGRSVLSANLGETEDGLALGDGVDTPTRADGSSWRWLGKNGLSATLYFTESQLRRAKTLTLDASCPEPDIELRLRVDGAVTDSVGLAAKTRREYDISLE